MSSWLDYVDARRRMIHEWHERGVDAVDITFRFVIGVDYVTTILHQPIDPPFYGTSRALVAELRGRVSDLERLLHKRDSQPPERPVPTASLIRSLLSNPNPALCGCQYFAPADGVIVPDEHHPDCVFAVKTKE
jgi:hypothetical protein